MVCQRCINSVQSICTALGITPTSVKLGQVALRDKISKDQLLTLESKLKKNGFELIDHETPIMVLHIKAALISVFNKNDIPENFKLSTFIKDKFPYDYSHVSRVFSQHENRTLEQYVIRLRIEKAKELLTHKELNISEVAYRLGYGSHAHFSRQFKNMTGMSPSKFKAAPSNRIALDDI